MAIFAIAGAAKAESSRAEADLAQSVLFRPHKHIAILAPETGSIDAFLRRLERAANACSGAAPGEGANPLVIDPAVAMAAATVRRCLGVSAAGEAAAPLDGAITVGLWRVLTPDAPPPDVALRASAMTLSFEATPFDRAPIWNLCQDVPGDAAERARAVSRGAQCANRSDPCSLLTWGPRGATAGQGREVQWILWRLERSAPESLTKAFGKRAPALRRLSRLRPPAIHHCDGSSDLEAALCGVWSDPKERAAWDQGFLRLSRDARARDAFRGVYALTEFDGYKLRAYRALWEALELAPTEIDYAFFFDRATHIGAPPQPGQALGPLRACIAADRAAGTRNAAARRCLSAAHIHADMPIDRLGRDVAYYRDAYPEEALSERERRIWRRHIPLDAAWNFGLSDERPAPPELFDSSPAAAQERPPFEGARATMREKACAARLWPR